MDMQRVKEIESFIEDAEFHNGQYSASPAITKELLQTIKQQHDLIERYEKAYKQLSPYEQWKIDDILEANHARTD